MSSFFFFNDTATTEIYTLSLHDALPIYLFRHHYNIPLVHVDASKTFLSALEGVTDPEQKRKTIGKLFIDVFDEDRKSTRLNSSHTVISYAVFCLSKKMKARKRALQPTDR